MHFYIPFLEGYKIVEDAKKQLSGMAKTFRYMMSHVSGKIEIINIAERDGDRIGTFKYHQARNPKFLGEIMTLIYRNPAYWLDDIFKHAEHSVIEGIGAVKYAKQQMNLL